MSREWFENLVKRKIRSSAAQNLQSVGLSHSKSVKIVSQKFEKQSYFSDRGLAKYDKQLLFKLRTSNFEGQFNDMTCRVCNEEGSVENEDHILQCSVLKT